MRDRLDSRVQLGLLELELLELELVQLEQLVVELLELGRLRRLDVVQLELLELELLQLELDLVVGRGRRRLRPLGLMLRALAPAGVKVDAGTLDQRVAALIAALGTVASAAIVADGGELHASLTGTPGRVATIGLLTLGLQMFSIRVYGRGSVGVSAIGILAGVYLLPLAAAMAIAALAAAAQWLRTRPRLYKGAFDISNYAVSAGVASVVFHAFGPWRTAGALQGRSRTCTRSGAGEGVVVAGVPDSSESEAATVSEAADVVDEDGALLAAAW